jgi:hypothetical protein
LASRASTSVRTRSAARQNATPPPLTRSWNDQMSSWENAAGVNYCWAVNINGGGTRHLMRAGVSLQNVLPSENDTASSIERSSTNCL